jgi:hypothetical protein
MQRLYIRRKNGEKPFEPIIRIIMGVFARGIVAEPPDARSVAGDGADSPTRAGRSPAKRLALFQIKN